MSRGPRQPALFLPHFKTESVKENRPQFEAGAKWAALGARTAQQVQPARLATELTSNPYRRAEGFGVEDSAVGENQLHGVGPPAGPRRLFLFRARKPLPFVGGELRARR
jgi:hypothetical protein